MPLATSRLIAGRRILRIDLNPFDDGRGGTAYAPVIWLDNGAKLIFDVAETDVGVYGVTPDYRPPTGVPRYKRADRRFVPSSDDVAIQVQRRTKARHVQDAAERDMEPCPTCKANRGDPCRTPSWRTREPHGGRKSMKETR